MGVIVRRYIDILTIIIIECNLLESVDSISRDERGFPLTHYKRANISG